MIGIQELTEAEQLKFAALAEGVTITAKARAFMNAANQDRALTPADYASTTGIILALDDDVWVNAPIAAHNPNFVVAPRLVLDLDGEALLLRGAGLSSPARFWLPPAFHQDTNEMGELYTTYAFTHADRVRISPIGGCAMTCQFCNLPYEHRYHKKRIQGLCDVVDRALHDTIQPASHVLISGGTPRSADIGYVRDVYEAVITGFTVPVDIMMVPLDDLMDVEWLSSIGVSEISVNLEIFNLEIARALMRRKADQGRENYLSFLERAAEVLGPGRVRSMLMVGLEPLEDTLAGVQAIVERGAVPVLSPFRPDEATPLRGRLPLTANELLETYLRSRDIAVAAGRGLGPSCIPCTHNTLTLALAGSGDAAMSHGSPRLV